MEAKPQLKTDEGLMIISTDKHCDELLLIMFLTLMFVVLQESGLCMRQCCGKDRGFIMHIVNNYTQVVTVSLVSLRGQGQDFFLKAKAKDTKIFQGQHQGQLKQLPLRAKICINVKSTTKGG